MCLKYAPEMPGMPITSCAHETTMSVYMPHMNSMQLTMQQDTLVYMFHNTDICPRTNTPDILHIYVPLHCYCSLHIDPTLLHISVKKKKKQIVTLIYHATATCANNKDPLQMPHA